MNLLAAWKYFDSGPGMNRILLLTNDENLDLLCQSERLCGDGTFKAAPKLWTQLYTVHASHLLGEAAGVDYQHDQRDCTRDVFPTLS